MVVQEKYIKMKCNLLTYYYAYYYMGQCYSCDHEHTWECCPEYGKWCEKIGRWDGTSLHYAIRYGYSESRCLNGLSKTRNIHIVDIQDYTLLHCLIASNNLCYLELLQRLIDRGIDINATTNRCNTALHLAAEFNHAHVVNLLIDNGAFVNVFNSRGWSPLSIAAQFGQFHVAKILIDNGATVNITDNLHRSPLHFAARCGRKNTCILLLEEGANVHTCAHVSHHETYSVLVAYGYPLRVIVPAELPQYLADMADAAFSRRKAAIRWWFGRNV
jgi:ankyrin repeat protein